MMRTKNVQSRDNRIERVIEMWALRHPGIAMVALFIGVPFTVLAALAACGTAIMLPIEAVSAMFS